jgi:hypothetical protein
MSSDESAIQVRAAAQRLAHDLRSGLELRWSIPTSPADLPNPFPPQGNVRSFLGPYADALRFSLPCRRQPLQRLMRLVRYLARILIAPWLRFQTGFNLTSISVIEQIEQRLRALEQAEVNLRQMLETLEQTLQTTSEPNQPGEPHAEGYRVCVDGEKR